MKERPRDDKFADGINRAYFANGLIEAYTSKVSDDKLRDQIEKDLEYLIDDRKELFREGPLSGYLHDGDDDAVEELLVRSVYEAWERIVLKPPALFTITPGDPRKEMLALKWDVAHFIDTISVWTADADGLLDRFEYLDKTSETMTLITQNYVNMLIKECQGHTKQEQTEILRDLRIQNTLR